MRRTIAAADVGGTNARFAIATIDEGHVQSLGEAVALKTDDFPSLESAWAEFCRRSPGEEPDSLAVAFAGPIRGNELKLTNSNWRIRRDSLSSDLGLRQHLVINDFEAIGYAVASLGPENYRHLYGPDEPLPDSGMTSIVGPGTGLGVAALLRRPDGFNVIATEGGHVDFAPLDEVEDRIVARLRATIGRASVDRIASGPGLVLIYQAIAECAGKPAVLTDERALWTAAMEGSDPLAAAALDRFFLILGSVAGDYTLSHGAVALVIAGGLGLRLADHWPRSGFAERFIAKGRFERQMNRIPVKLITHPQPGLLGAAAAFARECA